MIETTIINAASEGEIRQQLTAYLQREGDAFQHRVSLQDGQKTILLDIDIDPGGGFESGYATTRFSAPVAVATDFAFTFHPEGFLSDFAKLFGLQDEVVGYPEFDEKVIIKTNDAEKVRAVFSDGAVRQTLSALSSYNLQLDGNNEADRTRKLTLEIEEGITEPAALLPLYHTFRQVLAQVEAVEWKWIKWIGF